MGESTGKPFSGRSVVQARRCDVWITPKPKGQRPECLHRSVWVVPSALASPSKMEQVRKEVASELGMAGRDEWRRVVLQPRNDRGLQVVGVGVLWKWGSAN